MSAIREAGLSDVPQLINLGQLMHAESPTYRAIPFDEDHVRRKLTAAIPQGGCFVAEVTLGVSELVGMAVAFIGDLFFSPVLTCYEFVLYVRPEARARRIARDLVEALEEWALGTGCHDVRLEAGTGIDDERVGAFYESLGYRRSGLIYTKEL